MEFYQKMIKFLRKISKFKTPWKLRLRFFYFFAKIHGAAHFSYDEKKKKVCHSLISVAYGSAWVVCYFTELILLMLSFSEAATALNESDVLYFVHVMELTTIILKASFIYSLQVVQSKHIVLVINDAIGINQLINYGYRNEVNIYSEHFERLYKLKERCLFLQFLLLSTSYYLYILIKGGETAAIILGFLVVYTHFSTVAVSGIYFYGSLLFGYDFYYFLNRKLKKILKNDLNRTRATIKLKIEKYCRACDELEKLSLVYSRVNAYIKRINRLSVVQITGELLASFIMITSGLFYLFYALLSPVVTGESLTFTMAFYEISNTAIYSLVFCSQIYTIICISSTVIAEANKLSTHIHQTVFIDADKRFIRCIEQLSLQVLLEKPNIAPMGMFVIDKRLIIGIIATIGTYLVILIQFQLDRTQ